MPTQHEIEDLVQQLSSPNGATRSYAECQLRAIGADTVLPLLDFIKTKPKRAQKYRRLEICWNWFCIVTTLSVIYAFFVSVANAENLNFICLLGLAWVLLLKYDKALLRKLAISSEGLAGAYRILSELKEPRIFGVLLSSLRVNGLEEDIKVERLLLETLPGLSIGEWQKLNENQRRIFYHCLQEKASSTHNFNTTFVLIGLKALEQIGDAEAIPTIENIRVNASNRVMWEAARVCIKHLEIRRDKQAISQTLLRASSSDGQEGELLRAASLSETRRDELLRIPRS